MVIDLPAICDPSTRGGLARRASERCVVWPDQPLPPGCTPTRARIGVECDRNGTARLLVDIGATGRGLHPELVGWFETGTYEFDSMGSLLTWVDARLAPAYGAPASPPALDAPRDARPPAALTDLSAVRVDDELDVVFLDPDEVAEAIAAQVVGQDAAVSTMARRVTEHLAQERPLRPLSLFAVGPTGTGKTSASERLAGVLQEHTGEAWPFIRLDMGEYRESHRISQLLGAPAGYVGHGGSTPLLDVLAGSGRAVVLFDEIDKAHPDVWTAIMNALDAGRITGADTPTVDCRRAIFVFTSNRFAEELLATIPPDADDEAVDRECRSRFRTGGMLPELVGRLRSFLLFRRLSPEAVAEAGVLSVRRTVEAYGLTLGSVDPRLVTELLRGTRRAGIGIRHLEYRATSLLGAGLAQAARTRRGGCVHLRWSGTGATVHLDGSATPNPNPTVPSPATTVRSPR